MAHYNHGPLKPMKHLLNAIAYLDIVHDHVHSFMSTVHTSADGYFQQNNMTCNKTKMQLTNLQKLRDAIKLLGTRLSKVCF